MFFFSQIIFFKFLTEQRAGALVQINAHDRIVDQQGHVSSGVSLRRNKTLSLKERPSKGGKNKNSVPEEIELCGELLCVSRSIPVRQSLYILYCCMSCVRGPVRRFPGIFTLLCTLFTVQSGVTYLYNQLCFLSCTHYIIIVPRFDRRCSLFLYQRLLSYLSEYCQQIRIKSGKESRPCLRVSLFVKNTML